MLNLLERGQQPDRQQRRSSAYSQAPEVPRQGFFYRYTYRDFAWALLMIYFIYSVVSSLLFTVLMFTAEPYKPDVFGKIRLSEDRLTLSMMFFDVFASAIYFHIAENATEFYIFIGFFTICSSVFAVSALYGVYKRKLYFLIPWMVFSFIQNLMSLTLVYSLVVETYIGIYYVLIGGFALVVRFYTCIIVTTYFQVLATLE